MEEAETAPAPRLRHGPGSAPAASVPDPRDSVAAGEAGQEDRTFRHPAVRRWLS